MHNRVYTIDPCPYCDAVKRLLRDLTVTSKFGVGGQKAAWG